MDNWIPITEKLPSFYPNKRQKVLVTMEDDKDAVLKMVGEG